MTPKRGRPKKRVEFIPNEVATQQAIVDFYQSRLDEAEEKLGAIIANHGKRPK